ncbi:MAG: ribosome biogenesis GTP-binding protein YihA/YsxC [Deltaproteobacteria bacterium]|jgi:GTP-binding protein|nr:ribosome biogenesis GTP-binding protein YihA/YsxC [Deltaproteobacteria bacterium]
MAVHGSPPAIEASFVLSAAKASQFPEPLGLEVALVGRSNCGKSSLINRWLGRRALARVGASPGRTRLVNFFRVVWRPMAEPMTVVDLPGYGYAAAPKAMVEGWKFLVGQYLEAERPNRLALLLMDIRRGAQREEEDLARWFGGLGFPFQVIATKADKIVAGRAKGVLDALWRTLGGLGRPMPFSSLTGQGREELIAFVAQRQLGVQGPQGEP